MPRDGLDTGTTIRDVLKSRGSTAILSKSKAPACEFAYPNILLQQAFIDGAFL